MVVAYTVTLTGTRSIEGSSPLAIEQFLQGKFKWPSLSLPYLLLFCLCLRLGTSLTKLLEINTKEYLITKRNS